MLCVWTSRPRPLYFQVLPPARRRLRCGVDGQGRRVGEHTGDRDRRGRGSQRMRSRREGQYNVHHHLLFCYLLNILSNKLSKNKYLFCWETGTRKSVLLGKVEQIFVLFR